MYLKIVDQLTKTSRRASFVLTFMFMIVFLLVYQQSIYNQFGHHFSLSYSTVNKNGTKSISEVTKNNELCPLIPPGLTGPLKVNTDILSFEKLEEIFPQVESGGRYRPKDCIPRYKVAIIIPYRNREDNLKVFLHNLHPFLQKQQLDYGIFVIEQFGNKVLNRGTLKNIGFLEALKLYDYQCFIFHDVDHIPEDDRILYSCPEQPRHLAVATDINNYKLLYDGMFGGVVEMTKQQFEKINGYSNKFVGWGGEDDDLYNRVTINGYNVSRYPESIARYKLLGHVRDKPNPNRYEILYFVRNKFKIDGINSFKYERINLTFYKLYTWVLVDI